MAVEKLEAEHHNEQENHDQHHHRHLSTTGLGKIVESLSEKLAHTNHSNRSPWSRQMLAGTGVVVNFIAHPIICPIIDDFGPAAAKIVHLESKQPTSNNFMNEIGHEGPWPNRIRIVGLKEGKEPLEGDELPEGFEGMETFVLQENYLDGITPRFYEGGRPETFAEGLQILSADLIDAGKEITGVTTTTLKKLKNVYTFLKSLKNEYF